MASTTEGTTESIPESTTNITGTAAPDAGPADRGGAGVGLTGAALAAAGMVCVGSSVAVSTTIADAPLFTLQAVRYAAATLVLLAVARLRGWHVPMPRGTEWLWLVALATSGLVVFNIGIVRGVAHAEPAVIGVAVAAVPVLLALVPPLVTRQRPGASLVTGAVVVTAGAALVQGGGRTDAEGVGFAALVLTCEAAFTLLAVPLLGRLGAFGVSFHAVWLATIGLAVLGALTEGPRAATTLTAGDLLAAGHLAVVVTALAFLMWYSAVGRLGAGRAGLFTGLVPVTAAALGILLGSGVPGPVVWAGTALVALGVAIGLRGPVSRLG